MCVRAKPCMRECRWNGACGSMSVFVFVHSKGKKDVSLLKPHLRYLNNNHTWRLQTCGPSATSLLHHPEGRWREDPLHNATENTIIHKAIFWHKKALETNQKYYCLEQIRESVNVSFTCFRQRVVESLVFFLVWVCRVNNELARIPRTHSHSQVYINLRNTHCRARNLMDTWRHSSKLQSSDMYPHPRLKKAKANHFTTSV